MKMLEQSCQCIMALKTAVCLVVLVAIASGCGGSPEAAGKPDLVVKPEDRRPEAAAKRKAAAAGETYSFETEVLGPWTGEQAPLHPDNVSPIPIRYYGTDLGWTYEHQGELKILFGDTMATEAGDGIDKEGTPLLDDSYGSLDLAEWNEPERFGPGNVPPILLGQIPGSPQMVAIDPGVPMEGFKTPVGGWSNGESEFGLFFTSKPLGCRDDSDCRNGLSCDQGLGYAGQPYFDGRGQTFACLDGSFPACNSDTMVDDSGQPIAGSGFCSDPASTIWAAEGYGPIAAVGVKHIVGRRSEENPGQYVDTFEWLTNRFLNPAVRTVEDFDPAVDPAKQDYGTALGGGGNSRLFVWGRPAFIGVAARGRPAGLYFAYSDLGTGTENEWQLNYFTGLDEEGKPLFSDQENDAVALDLDSTTPGVQTAEVHDVVDQMSVAWIEPLGKWLMFYGGGLTTLPYPPYLPDCGVLEYFTGKECLDVVIGNGALRARVADYPWGPWSPPQDLIAAGDPEVPEGQYGPGGMLRQAECTAPDCAPHTAARDVHPGEYGFFYSANIIPEWTRETEHGVDIVWNASTWDPYRIILLRTTVKR